MFLCIFENGQNTWRKRGQGEEGEDGEEGGEGEEVEGKGGGRRYCA